MPATWPTWCAAAAAAGYLSFMSDAAALPVSEVIAAVDDVVRIGLYGPAGEGIVLAVSGGLDSMVLLESAVSVARARIAAVATFDHGTGRAARDASRHVQRRGRELGLTVLQGVAPPGLTTEAAWREARWRFLHAQAAALGARVATAHTLDDQLETVVMRVLRGAGARGLAGLYAPSAILRPLLEVPRCTVARYAATRGVTFALDPSNESRRHLRNRIRLDLLPALRRHRPTLAGELLAIAREAAAWRARTDSLAAELVATVRPNGGLRIASTELAGYSPEALAVLWPALAARGGIRLDRRGTDRLAAFTTEGSRGATIQLAGGWEVVRTSEHLDLRRTRCPPFTNAAVPLTAELQIGGWRFRCLQGRGDESPWSAALPHDRMLAVRAWRPGDRMTAHGSPGPRRIKRFLREAGIDRPDRAGWPVVLADEEIVWIPGVRRSNAATDRPGLPALWYACERIDR